MKQNTSDKILSIIAKNGSTTAKELIYKLKISPQAVHRQLKKLLLNDKIIKFGKTPKVFYSLPQKNERIYPTLSINIPEDYRQEIDSSFLLITPSGDLIKGQEALIHWAEKRGLEPEKTAKEYVKTLRKYNSKKRIGFINSLPKFKKTFPRDTKLDKAYYIDFYSIERFGKTKLGTLLLYAKQSQNRHLIAEINKIIHKPILDFIKRYKIDAVAFIPPTIHREVQFQKEIEKLLNLSLPKIKLVKIINEIAVPQKSLAKLKDRVINAQSTIFVDESNSYKNILLIDDAVGSGATLNEVARKIKGRKLCHGKLFGLALTGSFKGFEVVSEV